VPLLHARRRGEQNTTATVRRVRNGARPAACGAQPANHRRPQGRNARTHVPRPRRMTRGARSDGPRTRAVRSLLPAASRFPTPPPHGPHHANCFRKAARTLRKVSFSEQHPSSTDRNAGGQGVRARAARPGGGRGGSA
jgi:hypothetical protein